jgi:hypothetical protein
MHVGASEVAISDLNIDDPSRVATISWLFLHDLRAALDAHRHPWKHGALRSKDLDLHARIVPATA